MKTKSKHTLERDIEHYILKWEYDIFQRMSLTIILNMNLMEKTLNSKNSTCILLQSMEPNAFVLYYVFCTLVIITVYTFLNVFSLYPLQT